MQQQDLTRGQTQQEKRAERRAKKQKRKADENQLQKKREEMDKAKVTESILLTGFAYNLIASGRGEAYSYLLGQTELFNTLLTSRSIARSFVQSSINCCLQRARDPEYAALMDAQPKPKGRGRKKVKSVDFLLLQYHLS